MSIELASAKENNALVWTLKGRLDTLTAPKAQEDLLPSLEANPNSVLDFSEVDYISSAGLRVLLMAQKKARASGGSIVIARLDPKLKHIFDISGFSQLFYFADSKAEALTHFNH